MLISITLQTQPFIISIALPIPSKYIHPYNHLASLNFHNVNDNHRQSGIIYMNCIELKHVIRNFFINNFYLKIFLAILLHKSDFGIWLLECKTCHHAPLLLKTMYFIFRRCFRILWSILQVEWNKQLENETSRQVCKNLEEMTCQLCHEDVELDKH